jgi:hypothetical protein
VYKSSRGPFYYEGVFMYSIIKKVAPLMLASFFFCMIFIPNSNLLSQSGEIGIRGGIGNRGFGVSVGDATYGVGNGYYNGFYNSYDIGYAPSNRYDNNYNRYYNNYPTSSYYYYNTPGDSAPDYNGYYYQPFYFRY